MKEVPQRSFILRLADPSKATIEALTDYRNFDLALDYHFGGYAKPSSVLAHFTREFHTLNPTIALEPVYSARLFYGVLDQLASGRLAGDKILIVHTSSFLPLPRPS